MAPAASGRAGRELPTPNRLAFALWPSVLWVCSGLLKCRLPCLSPLVCRTQGRVPKGVAASSLKAKGLAHSLTSRKAQSQSRGVGCGGQTLFKELDNQSCTVVSCPGRLPRFQAPRHPQGHFPADQLPHLPHPSEAPFSLQPNPALHGCLPLKSRKSPFNGKMSPLLPHTQRLSGKLLEKKLRMGSGCQTPGLHGKCGRRKGVRVGDRVSG